MHAGLIFRVGRADETLARPGITHLLEHLALHRHGLADYHYNGATGRAITHFHIAGPRGRGRRHTSTACAPPCATCR